MQALDPPMTARFHDALSFASGLHASQGRKAQPGSRVIPYISHLLAVCAIVLEAGGTEDEAIAAVLHDAAEDQGGLETLQRIRARYGPDVEKIVRHCSDTFEVPKPEFDERKRAYRESLKNADASTLLVSVADKLHNARSTLRDLKRDGDETWELFNAPKEGTLGNYDMLLEVYTRACGAEESDGRIKPLVEELRTIVQAMRAY